MRVCCDTSYLFSLYGNDIYTESARQLLEQIKASLYISEINEYELANAYACAAFRKIYPLEEANKSWDSFEFDLLTEKIHRTAINYSRLWPEAIRLNWLHTNKNGYRSFDLLLVAAALHLKATHFFTFDQQQMRLAKAVGLKVNL